MTDRTDNFRILAGSPIEEINFLLMRQIMQAIEPADIDQVEGVGADILAATMMSRFSPADEIEGALATQATACHHLAMAAFRSAARAPDPDEKHLARREALGAVSAFTGLVDTLTRYRASKPSNQDRGYQHDGGLPKGSAGSARRIEPGIGKWPNLAPGVDPDRSCRPAPRQRARRPSTTARQHAAVIGT